MEGEILKMEPTESEQDEEEDVYEVERIIDMRVEEGEVLYRVRWKNYCSDDDTWEPEAHLEDCREVLLAFKKAATDAKKEAEAKKVVQKPLPAKNDVFDTDSESDSDRDRPTEAPVKKKKKKKVREEEEELLPRKEKEKEKKKKKKKKDKWRDEFKPVPAPETDEEELMPQSPPQLKEKSTEEKKRLTIDSDDEDDESAPPKKPKKDKGKVWGKHKKDRGEEGKKKKAKKEEKIESSEDEAPAAPHEDELSEGFSDSQQEEDTQAETLTKPPEKVRGDDKFKHKKGKLDVKLQGIKDLIQDRKSKKTDALLKESSLHKLKSLTSKGREEAGRHSSDSSDSSSLHKKAKSKCQESASAPNKTPSSASASSSSGPAGKVKEDEASKDDGTTSGQKDTKGSTNLFETFLLNCEAKDRAPRRPPAHPPNSERSSNKPPKMIGKIEKISKPVRESPSQKEPERTEKTKQIEVAAKPSQSHGFSLDSDEMEGQEPATKPREEHRERPEESLRPSWERRGQMDDRRKRRDASEPRLLGAVDDHVDGQDLLQTTDKSDKGPATMSLGMDLNLDWLTLDDFQKHLNGEDEILSAAPLSPSELRDAVKSGDYMAVKLALNSKEEYNLDQEACTFGEKKSLEGKRSLIEKRSHKDPFITEYLNGPQGGDCANEDIQNDGREPEKTTGDSYLHHENQGSRISEDIKADSSSNLTLSFDIPNQPTNVENKLPKDLDLMEGNIQPADTNYLSENANKVVAGHFASAGQISWEEGSKNTGTTRRSRRTRKTVEAKQPTRTSQRACKKVVRSPEPSTEEEDMEKEPSKKHFCLYCKMPFTQLAKHLEKKHADETDVAHAIHFPKGSKVRQTLLDQIRNNGDYEHHSKALKNGGEEQVALKKLTSPKICVRDFLPCQHCYTFYRKTDLWRHEHSCRAKKSDEKSTEIPQKEGTICNTTSQLLPMSEVLTEGCKEIIHIMHQDDIARHIRNDPLICKYGNALSAKYDHDKSQFAYIGQKMRELGRFMFAVNELDKSVQYLHELCLPSRFELAVEGAKKVSGFDPSCSKFRTFSLVSKIGYSLKRAAEIAFGESRMTEDSQTESEVKRFIQLVDTKWNQCFSRKSLSLSSKQEVRKVEVDTSSVTEDLIKLYRFITEEEHEARKELKERPSVANWKKLSEATLADVCLFNRARVGNIGRLLLHSYTSKKFCGTFVPTTDQIKKCTKLEVELGKHFTRLELEGQYGRNMLVLLTEKMSLSLDLLVENRKDAGVSKSNPYLFARTEGPSFIRGLDCFRRATVECGVKNPEALLSPSLRVQIANCWQLMSLNERELDQVAKLLKKSSQECHTLAKNASQLEEASKQLLHLDRTRVAVSDNTSGTGTPSKAALKRRPWSEKEQAAVKRYMSEFLGKMKVPGKKDCNACIAAEPDLSGRSWTDVKNYVHNSIQTIRRRSNQHKDERNSKDVNPKTPVAEVQTNARTELEAQAVGCSMSLGLPEHLRESSDCCMTMEPHTNLREPPQYTREIPLTYTSLCSTSANMVHTGQPLMSSFTPLNATDTQVVPTFTPHSTTHALSPVYTTDIIHPMATPYSQNSLNIAHPSMYAPQDHLNAPMLPSFSPHSVPCTSMLPTYTPLNSPSPPIGPAFSSSLSDRSQMMMSSFTPLNHSSTPSYSTSPPRTSMTAQVVPTVHGVGIHNRLPLVQERASASTPKKQVPQSAKPQKRNKRLWSGDEQAAVRRQFGDFGKLVKVPGKKDCDACLVAEPALSSRTWREVKYYVHNSIQSIKRRGHPAVPQQTEEPKQQLETPMSNLEWDGPVYLSL